MAKSVDMYSDLSELGINCENEELEEQFNKAAKHLQTLVPSINKDALLTLYGYYKQGTDGPCNIPKPSWFDMKAKAKWESWNKLGQMSKFDAQKLYIKEIKKIDDNFDCSKNSHVKESWVTVSTLQPKEEPSNKEKSLVDFVKDGDIKKVYDILSTYCKEQLETVNNIDEEGLGLIHWAADRGSAEILKVLVDFGADINLKDLDQQTPLHYAASCGHVECIKFLLSKNADTKIKDADGLDPLAVAADDVKNLLLINT